MKRETLISKDNKTDLKSSFFCAKLSMLAVILFFIILFFGLENYMILLTPQLSLATKKRRFISNSIKQCNAYIHSNQSCKKNVDE